MWWPTDVFSTLWRGYPDEYLVQLPNLYRNTTTGRLQMRTWVGKHFSWCVSEWTFFWWGHYVAHDDVEIEPRRRGIPRIPALLCNSIEPLPISSYFARKPTTSTANLIADITDLVQSCLLACLFTIWPAESTVSISWRWIVQMCRRQCVQSTWAGISMSYLLYDYFPSNRKCGSWGTSCCMLSIQKHVYRTHGSTQMHPK